MSSQALRIARETYQQPGIEFHELDAQGLPFPEKSFDVVISFEVIEHVPRCEAFVAECRRVLRDGGMLFCSTPNKAAVSPDSSGTYRSHHFHEFYPDELIGLLLKHFGKVSLFGRVPFQKGEKIRDDFLYNVALWIAPGLSLRQLILTGRIINMVTWLPPLRDYRLIKIEESKDWDRFHNQRFQPYPADKGFHIPLGLLCVASVKTVNEDITSFR